MLKKLLRVLLTLLAVSAAAFVMALNNRSFISTGGLYPGGVTGLTMLIQRAAQMLLHIELPFTAVNLALNLIPVYIGFRYIGKTFTLYSCIMIVLNSVLTDLLPSYVITEDVLLISIFGGLIHGAAIAVCLNAGATSGGTDFISIFLSERSGVDSFNIIFGFNAVILCIAGLMFGWDKALYSIIFQYAATAVLHVLYKRYQQSTLFIVTAKPEEICEMIYEKTRHGATILEGEGAHSHCERRVVYSIVSAAQSRQVMRAAVEIDPEAFLNEVKTQKLAGYFYQPKAGSTGPE